MTIMQIQCNNRVAETGGIFVDEKGVFYLLYHLATVANSFPSCSTYNP